MSARILTATPVRAEPTVLAPPVRAPDDATRDLVARERASAHAAGVEEGRRQAQQEAAEVAAAVDGAAWQTIETVRAQHAELAAALGERVTAAVAAVLGHEPDDGGRVLVDRLTAAIAGLDDAEVTVHVPAARHDVVDRALADDAVVVVVDDALGRDEARIVGSFARVDLRTAALLAALDEVLADDSPLGPIAAPVDEGTP